MTPEQIAAAMAEWDAKNPAPRFGPGGDFWSVAEFNSAWCMSGSVPPMPIHEAWVARRRAYQASLAPTLREIIEKAKHAHERDSEGRLRAC